MDTGAHKRFDWGQGAPVALNDLHIRHQHEECTVPDGSSAPTHDLRYSIAPYLLDHNFMEQSSLCNSCDELSASAICFDYIREASVPIKKLGNEAFWPEQQLNLFQRLGAGRTSYSGGQQPSSERHHTSEKIADAHIHVNIGTPQQVANPQPLKRKRGRPRSNPRTGEAHTSDTFPTLVPSARKFQLEKNRVAAEKCRKRKKGYIAGLEARAGEMSSKNEALKADETALREKVLNCKNEMLRHAGCQSWTVDGYLARCAGDILGREASSLQAQASKDSNRTLCSTAPSEFTSKSDSETVTETLPSQVSAEFRANLDEYVNLGFLNDREDVGDLA